MHWLFFLTVVLSAVNNIIICSFKQMLKTESIRPVMALFSNNLHIINRTGEKINSLKKLIDNLPHDVERKMAEEYLEVA